MEVETPFEEDECLLPSRMSVQTDAGPWLLKLVCLAVHSAEVLNAVALTQGVQPAPLALDCEDCQRRKDLLIAAKKLAPKPSCLLLNPQFARKLDV